MKTLITGGNGYIGSHLATALLEKGHSLHALIYPGTDASTLLEQGVKVFTGDIRDYHSVERAARGCGQVYHLASYVSLWAQKPSIFYDINVKGTQNLLNVCRNSSVRRVLVCSSCAVFGPSQNGEMVNETTDYSAQLKGHYELSKFHQVEVAKNYMDDGLEIVFVYPTRVFGPHLKSASSALSTIIEGVLRGTWRIIPGSGKSVANYIFVEDVVKGMLLAMEKGGNGEGYILSGHHVTYGGLFEMVLEAAVQRPRRFIRIPYPVMWLAGSALELYSKLTGKKPPITRHSAWKFDANWKVSSEKIKQSLGFEPTPMRDAIQATVEAILEDRTSSLDARSKMTREDKAVLV
jgi:nucleoside-diphosphate-sugar epimerase